MPINLPNLSNLSVPAQLQEAQGSSIRVHDPLSPNAEDNIFMSPPEWKSTFDQDFQRRKPYLSALNGYYNPAQSTRSLGYSMGKGLSNFRKEWAGTAGDILNKGPLIGGLASAAPGLLLGGVGTGLANLLSGNDMGHNVSRNALIAALLTGGLGAFSGYTRKYKPTYTPYYAQPVSPNKELQEQLQTLTRLRGVKSAMYGEAFSPSSAGSSSVTMAIQNAPGLSFNERSKLIAGVSQLDPTSLQQLARALNNVGGAAVGAIVSKFLLNKGLIGTVLGAIFGGAVAKAVFGTPNNALGQQSMQGRTFSGKNI